MTWSTIEKNRFLPLLDATHQDFPVGESFHIVKVSIAELRKLFTYLLSPRKRADVECAATRGSEKNLKIGESPKMDTVKFWNIHHESCKEI